MQINLPTLITIFRILLTPLFIIVCYSEIQQANVIAASIFCIASASDALDGFLARKLNQSTKFGAFLDPLADKIMVATALVILVEKYSTWMVSIPAILLIGRELIIAAIREWMATIGNNNSVAVSFIGKCKTLFQMTSVMILILNYNQYTNILGYICLYASLVCSMVSIYQYAKAAIKTS